MHINTKLAIRTVAALSTDYVMATDSIYSDVANTEDTNQDLSTTGANADREWVARKIPGTLITSNGFISTVTLVMGRTGLPAGYVYAAIYSDSTGPSAQVGGDSEKILANTLSADAGGASLTFRWVNNCPSVVMGANYWVVVKTTGYTYTDTSIEIRWRTDADGATGLSECWKYDANAAPTWTTMGANVGADIVVGVAKAIPIGMADKLNLYVYYVKGNSDSCRVKVEFSDDLLYWVQETYPVLPVFANGVISHDTVERDILDEGNQRIQISGLSDNYARVSIKAVTDATNATAGIDAVVGKDS